MLFPSLEETDRPSTSYQLDPQKRDRESTKIENADRWRPMARVDDADDERTQTKNWRRTGRFDEVNDRIDELAKEPDDLTG